jgi:hypothetical protein
MVSSGMLRRVAFVTSVLTRATRRNIPEDGILLCSHVLVALIFLLSLMTRSLKFGDYFYNFVGYSDYIGARGSVVVKALCYKPEGRGFETR